MLKNLAFWRVSADTKTCGSPLNPAPTGGSLRQAQDRLRLPAGKYECILIYYQTIVKEKMKKKCFFNPQIRSD